MPSVAHILLMLKKIPDRLCVHHVKQNVHTPPCQGMIDISKRVLLVVDNPYSKGSPTSATRDTPSYSNHREEKIS